MSNPVFWSNFGFWLLILGLIGDFGVLFVESRKVEKTLAAIFTILIAVGVAVEHMADSQRFGARQLSAKQIVSLSEQLKPLAIIPGSNGKSERVELTIFPVSNEAARLASQIGTLIEAAGWTCTESPCAIKSGEGMGGTSSGVGIFTMPGNEQSTRCANSLVAALESENIDATVYGNIPHMPPPNFCDRTDPYCSRIIVVVGDHP